MRITRSNPPCRAVQAHARVWRRGEVGVLRGSLTGNTPIDSPMHRHNQKGVVGRRLSHDSLLRPEQHPIEYCCRRLQRLLDRWQCPYGHEAESEVTTRGWCQRSLGRFVSGNLWNHPRAMAAAGATMTANSAMATGFVGTAPGLTHLPLRVGAILLR
jgi:hypothetical protein